MLIKLILKASDKGSIFSFKKKNLLISGLHYLNR